MKATTNKAVRDEELKGFNLKWLFEKRTEMTRLFLLQFLEPGEIYKLALTCKGMKKSIDPNACDGKDSKRASMHFSAILVIQKLRTELTLSKELENKKKAEELTKTLDGIYTFDYNEVTALLHEIFGIEPVLLLKDLGSTNKFIYHES